MVFLPQPQTPVFIHGIQRLVPLTQVAEFREWSHGHFALPCFPWRSSGFSFPPTADLFCFLSCRYHARVKLQLSTLLQSIDPSTGLTQQGKLNTEYIRFRYCWYCNVLVLNTAEALADRPNDLPDRSGPPSGSKRVTSCSMTDCNRNPQPCRLIRWLGLLLNF